MGNYDGRWGKAKLPIPTDCCVCPLALPNTSLGAARSMLTTVSLVAKYMPVAPEFTMHVVFVWSARWRSVLVQLDITLLISGKGEGVMSRVGLKLTL